MEYKHKFNTYDRNALHKARLAEFDESIANMTKTQQRRERLAYLREAAENAKKNEVMLSSYGWLLIPCAVIIILWPFFPIIWFMRKKDISKMERQLEDALEYWSIHEVEVEAYISDDDSWY